MFLACPLSDILDSDSECDSDSDLDDGDGKRKGCKTIKCKSVKNIEWPTFKDQVSFDEEAGSKLLSLLKIVKYHLMDNQQ